MKKITLVGITIAAAIGFTACQKERLNVDRTPGRLVKETFSADIEQNTTKTTISDDAQKVNWAANDTIHYYTADGGPVRRDTIKTAGSSTTLNLFRETGDTYYNLVYSGSAAPTFTTKTGKSMVFDGVKPSQDGTFSNANVSVGRTTPGAGGSITFKPVTALVKFTTARTDIKTIVLTGGLGTETIAGNVSVDPTAASPKATLNGTGSTAITVTIGTPAAGTYYVNVLPVKYANGLKMTLKNSGGGIIGTVTASNSIDLSAGGKMINLGNIDSHIVLDAIDLSASGTANCYIVSEAGKYKFKAIKGNSTEAISSIDSVVVLWESYGTDTAPTVGDLIKTDVSYADGYITFTTGSQFPTQKGNAVIAAKGKSNTILWSWHIWLTDVPASQVYNNSAGTVMDRNLGATSATPGDVHALGLLYQWGRKDPFLGSSFIPYGIEAKSTGSWPSAVQSTASTGTFDYVEKHPMQFIEGNQYNYDWYYTGYSPMENTRWQTSDKTKGKYDPCPQGWRVPNGGNGLWSMAFGSSEYFEKGPWDETNKGMNFGCGAGSGHSLGKNDTIWYSASGWLLSSSGWLHDVGIDGLYWSCTSGNEFASTFCFYDNIVYPAMSGARAYGNSIRCVLEHSIPLPTVTTSLVSSVTETSASCGGNVADDGGSSVTARGVVWSTLPNPTLTSCTGKTTDGTGTGSFTSSLTNLSLSTIYYVRSYATNSVGTSYGEQKSFTTHIPGKTTDLSVSGTANCYIVSEDGKYKFKATKGNSTEVISSIDSVVVLWESFGTSTTPRKGDLIKTDISYADGYITFTTGSQFPTQTGNAVIAAKGNSNTILWSWHIWMTDVPASQVYNNSAGTMMDRNLGATSATPGDVHALGLLYQWGRKDPFLGADVIYYDYFSPKQAASTLTWPAAEEANEHYSSDYNTLPYSISHPTTFIKNNNGYSRDWYCTAPQYRNDELWKNNTGSAKTMYDPCPVGWHVPDGGDSGVWSTALDTNYLEIAGNWDYTNKGVDFGKTDRKLVGDGSDQCWYPAAGYRFYDKGLLYCVGESGDYWSCSPANDYAYYFTFGLNNNIRPSLYSNRATGRSVRCVKDNYTYNH